ncbi:hypothetical protein NDU88_005494 [Pleurodeles waltl]|uniref:Uncharacterized protein n=1 Tax=Pleurodeles waltl TaxID=8319 RepID=A0AAV7LPB9_PLEWA|nr:hypothetical protein NDU88_005494 [Pleurodeles waltl]
MERCDMSKQGVLNEITAATQMIEDEVSRRKRATEKVRNWMILAADKGRQQDKEEGKKEVDKHLEEETATRLPFISIAEPSQGYLLVSTKVRQLRAIKPHYPVDFP